MHFFFGREIASPKLRGRRCKANPHVGFSIRRNLQGGDAAASGASRRHVYEQERMFPCDCRPELDKAAVCADLQRFSYFVERLTAKIVPKYGYRNCEANAIGVRLHRLFSSPLGASSISRASRLSSR